MTARGIIAEAAASLDAMALELERVARLTGNGRARHAAAVLRGSQAGRPAIDDAAALAEIARLVTDGKPLRVALGIVARQLATGAIGAESIKRRLRYKLKKSGNNNFFPSSNVVPIVARGSDGAHTS